MRIGGQTAPCHTRSRISPHPGLMIHPCLAYLCSNMHTTNYRFYRFCASLMLACTLDLLNKRLGCKSDLEKTFLFFNKGCTGGNEHRFKDACFTNTIFFLSTLSGLCRVAATIMITEVKGEEIPLFLSQIERVTSGHYPIPLNSRSLQTTVRALGPDIPQSEFQNAESSQAYKAKHTPTQTPVFSHIMSTSVSTKRKNESKVEH